MPLINGMKHPKRGDGLFFLYSDDEDARQSAKELQDALKEYGLGIQVVDEKDWELHEADEKTSNATALRKFREWMRARESEDNEPDERLIMVYIAGHGAVAEDYAEYLPNGHLVCKNDDSQYSIDITTIQQAARDEFSMDVIFMVDLCHGSYSGLDMSSISPIEKLSYDDRKTMITISGRSELITIRGRANARDFAVRMAQNLRKDNGPLTVEQRLADMNSPGLETLVCRKNIGNRDIALMPVLDRLRRWFPELNSYYT